MENPPSTPAPDSGLVLSDEDVRRMLRINRGRRAPTWRATTPEEVRLAPDALTVWAERFGCPVREVADAVLANADRALREGRSEQAEVGLTVFIEAGQEILRTISGRMREWAEDPGRRPVRGFCLRLVLLGEGADAFPFAESFLREDRTSPRDRRILLNGARLVVKSRGSPGDIVPRLSSEARKEWDAFLKRFIEGEHDPEVFWDADRLMCSTVAGWCYSNEQLNLFERRALEYAETNPEQARRFRRGVEVERQGLERGETNVVMLWQVPIQLIPQTVQLVTNNLSAAVLQELRRKAAQ